MGATVFRGCDQEGLDREYDNRGKVASFADYVTRWARASEATCRLLPCRLDVPYGSGPTETLDVFPASGASSAPVQVFIHSGHWQRMDKADSSYVVRAFQPPRRGGGRRHLPADAGRGHEEPVSGLSRAILRQMSLH